MYKTIGDNIETAIEIVENCRYVAQLSSKATKQMESKKYYPALKVSRLIKIFTTRLWITWKRA